MARRAAAATAGASRNAAMAIDAASFGDAFLAAAVTPERVLSVVTQLVGDGVRIGPIPAGPGGIATATAEGSAATIEVRRLDCDRHRFVVDIELDLQLEVAFRGQRFRYPVRVGVPVHLAVQAVAPISIRIDADPVRPDEICLEMRAEGRTARLLGLVGNVEGQLRRQAGACIEELIDTATGRRLRTIDLVALIDRAWDAGLVWVGTT